MTPGEFSELLQYVREEVRRRGFGDLDQLLVRSRLADMEGAQRQLLAYLEGLRDEIALGSEDVMRQIMTRFREIRTADGRPVQGVVVAVEEADVPIYGTRRLDLAGSAELDDLVGQLDALMAELREDVDPQ